MSRILSLLMACQLLAKESPGRGSPTSTTNSFGMFSNHHTHVSRGLRTPPITYLVTTSTSQIFCQSCKDFTMILC
ncbi:hypothetical protein AUEXF2481DRAFT_384817 [Aureobasidium subglaciale EXF-2481]|uniref:Secreted protein n=1 Tax=Aureobasidium subglaciale (strain EXF-2481) TaxID=1043005 RepID=A0A074YMK8_AURSE|nr:uncharacterized protein AUEXF2481DRAFT_384817 [Aureobasidium subglaciale EXF-2481]KEQ98925.1 hypothetical protein AUEXF2481DRAFT_384817 [Aureobasidium subglaciale EXF-2481]